MRVAIIVLVIVLLIAGVFAAKMVGMRNTLVTEKVAIEGQWSQVDVVMQRRADLIPNLVATVKGYAGHELAAVQAVANARAALVGARGPAQRIQANNQLDGALGRLLVVVENYPNLKADEQFRNLQYELAGAENRIAIERRRYNEAVQRYNTDIELFPNNIAASLFGFGKNTAYFTTEPGAREVPKVNF